VSMEMLNKWLQLGANIGLIVGLVFLGLQMRQDRELKRLEFVMNTFETSLERTLAEMGENPMKSVEKAVYRPEEMSPQDVLVVTALLNNSYISWWRGTVMEELGVFTGRWRSQDNVSGWLFETGVGKRWLETADLNRLHPAIAEMLQRERERQASSSTTAYREWLDYLRQGSASSKEQLE